MFFILRTVVAFEVVLSAIVVNEVSYQKSRVNEFSEELVHRVEGMKSSPVGQLVNGV